MGLFSGKSSFPKTIKIKLISGLVGKMPRTVSLQLQAPRKVLLGDSDTVSNVSKIEYDLKYLCWSYGGEIVTTPEKEYIESKKQHALGRAMVGGILAGPAGAIVGATTAKTTSSTRIEAAKTIEVKNQAFIVLQNPMDSSMLILQTKPLNFDQETKLEKQLGIPTSKYFDWLFD